MSQEKVRGPRRKTTLPFLVVVVAVVLVTAGSAVVLATDASPAYLGTVVIATVGICAIALLIRGPPE
jgi:hypothetical protein